VSDDEPPPSINGLGVCVLEIPTAVTAAELIAVLSAHAPDFQLEDVDGRGADWKRIQAWLDIAMLSPIAVIERAGKRTKLPVYARLYLCAGVDDMSDDDVTRAIASLTAITDDLARRHGAVLIDFEQGAPELRKSCVELPGER
jgi:hypothetical protein